MAPEPPGLQFTAVFIIYIWVKWYVGSDISCRRFFQSKLLLTPLPSQDIVTYTCSQKMEQLSLPPPSLSTSASQSSHEEIKSEYMKPEVVTSAKSSFDWRRMRTTCTNTFYSKVVENVLYLTFPSGFKNQPTGHMSERRLNLLIFCIIHSNKDFCNAFKSTESLIWTHWDKIGFIHLLYQIHQRIRQVETRTVHVNSENFTSLMEDVCHIYVHMSNVCSSQLSFLLWKYCLSMFVYKWRNMKNFCMSKYTSLPLNVLYIEMYDAQKITKCGPLL